MKHLHHHDEPVQSPQLGIFWMHGRKLIHFAAPAEGVQEVEGFRDSPFDHDAYWVEVTKCHPKLREKEYFEVPRGRVIYTRSTGHYRILTSRKLARDADCIRRVRAAFQLPADTEVLVDEHYEPEYDAEPD